MELDDFLIFVFNLFLSREERKSKIIFDLCDFDRNGTISSLDLINLKDCAPESSLFYQEIKLISDYFVAQSITNKYEKRPPDFFTFDVFITYLDSY